MTVEVRYFARVREALGRDVDTVTLPDASCRITELEHLLRQSDPAGWQRVPGDTRLLFALNQQMVPADAVVQDGDVVAVFPPVTGG